MVCSKCGAEIKEGNLFCSVCGAEAVVVYDDEVLEDDYLKAILNGNDDLEKEKDKPVLQEKKNKKSNFFIIAIFLSIIILLFLIIGVIYIGKQTELEHASSYEYQVSMAQQAYMDGHLSEAIEYYENAIVLHPDDIAIRLRLASIYSNLMSYDQAQFLYMEVIQLDPSNVEAYRNLVQLYENRNDQEAILNLLSNTTEESVLDVFSDYLVSAPIFSEESGEYENYLEIEMFSNGANTIYYTTDNSDPVLYGKIYTEPLIYTSAGSYVIRAVCVNEKGIYSDSIIKNYKVIIPAPKTPVVTPDGGEFLEPTSVTIEVPNGCIAYYTWDGSDPNILSEEYHEPLDIPEGNHVLSVLIVQIKTEQTSPIYRQYFKYFPQ